MATCGPPLFLPPALKWSGSRRRQALCSYRAHLWAPSDFGPQGGRVYVATMPTCGPPLISGPPRKLWGPLSRQGLCSALALLWTTSNSAPCSEAVGPPKGYVAALPTCGPLLILPLDLPANNKGYVTTLPTCGPLLNLPLRFEAVGTHRTAGVMWPPCPLVCHLRFWLLLRSGGDLPAGRGDVATVPTCGPLLILPPALKLWGSHRRQGLCSHCAHLWATSDSAPCSEAVGSPQTARVIWPPCPPVGHVRFCPPLRSARDPQTAGVVGHF